MELEGFGEKSINNLIESIENSKSNSLEKLLFGLGIKQVGSKMAKVLSREFINLDELILASKERLDNIYTVGEIVADSIVSYFANNKNMKLIEKLKSIGVNTKYLGQTQIKNRNQNIYEKTFVITGSLSKSRDEIKELLESFGGKVTESVTSKTDVLILGESPGSKYEKAKDLNIEIWNEEDLFKKT
jgi:DNA ligase (NAD+)